MEVKKMRQRLRAFHPKLHRHVLLDQVNEVCLALDAAALKQLGDEVEGALAKEDGVEESARIMYKAIESLGLKPVVPEITEEDQASTTSGSGEATENDVSFEVTTLDESLVEDPKVEAKR